MPTDYILFVHGVKTRDQQGFCDAATKLFNRIQASVSDRSRELKPIFFFWGNLNEGAQRELMKGFDRSPTWKQFWFRQFRTEQILEFVGDAMLYLSRHVGAEVVRELKRQVVDQELCHPQAGDRLHLVTHSWGTVVLFDILFARRWDDETLNHNPTTQGIPEMVQEIRRGLFGLPPNPESGIPLASIHTMGSPIALFNLMNWGGGSHDLSDQLTVFLESLYNHRQGNPIPWRNFSHPGDPIAYPLEGIMPNLLRGKQSDNVVDVVDLMTGRSPWKYVPFSQQSLLPLVQGGEAHSSYWHSEQVAQEIASVIQQSMTSNLVFERFVHYSLDEKISAL